MRIKTKDIEIDISIKELEFVLEKVDRTYAVDQGPLVSLVTMMEKAAANIVTEK